MKKAMIICLSVALLLGTGCGSQGEAETMGENRTTPLTETGELTVCMEEADFEEGNLQIVLEEFQRKFSEVKLDVRTLPYAGYEDGEAVREAEIKKLKTEIMSGGGPDVFVLRVGRNYVCGNTENLFEDIEKAARSGVFWDLGQEINNEAVLQNCYSFTEKAGTMNGKLMILPLSFEMQAVLTTEKNMKEAGFRREKAEVSMNDFHEELISCLDEKEQSYVSMNYWKNLSYPVLNYETGEIQLGEKEKSYYEWTKQGNINSEKYDSGEWMRSDYEEYMAEQLADGNVKLQSGYLNTYIGIMNIARELASIGETPVFLKFPNEKGSATANITSYAAISGKSENKKNALEFLKILTSEEIQRMGAYPSYESLPIVKNAEVLKAVLEKRQKDSGEKGDFSEAVIENLQDIFEQVEYGSLQQLYEIPINGEKSYGDFVSEYMSDAITYEELVQTVTEGLEFYRNE